MRLLLDTHTFLWFVDNDPSLSHEALTLIGDPENDVFFSIASAWEIAIKTSTGKLKITQPIEPFLMSQLSQNRISLLDIAIHHVSLVSTMPLHHRDPFDRLLIAQAMAEQMPIISKDSTFDAYGITTIW